jgi:hypothetical protein
MACVECRSFWDFGDAQSQGSTSRFLSKGYASQSEDLFVWKTLVERKELGYVPSVANSVATRPALARSERSSSFYVGQYLPHFWR